MGTHPNDRTTTWAGFGHAEVLSVHSPNGFPSHPNFACPTGNPDVGIAALRLVAIAMGRSRGDGCHRIDGIHFDPFGISVGSDPSQPWENLPLGLLAWSFPPRDGPIDWLLESFGLTRRRQDAKKEKKLLYPTTDQRSDPRAPVARWAMDLCARSNRPSPLRALQSATWI